jgi:hypothetical protein
MFVVIRARRTSTASIARCAVAAPSERLPFRSRSHSATPCRCAQPGWGESDNWKAGLLRPRLPLRFVMSEKAAKVSKTVTVSERNLQSAALRLLPKHNKLVSPEVDYLRRVLGERATQQQIDEKVQQVRKLPWSEIVHE